MQLSNTFASIANYTLSSVKSGLSCGASKLSSLGRFGVSTIQSGASLACKTANCASRVFSNSASFAFNGIARHPKISIALGVLAGAAAIVAVAKKRFNVCVFEKLSGYCPFTTKKADKAKEAAEADKVEEVVVAAEADKAEEVVVAAEADKAEEVVVAAVADKAEEVVVAAEADKAEKEGETADAPTDVEDSPRS